MISFIKWKSYIFLTESKNGLCYNPENITSHLIFPPFLKKYERASKKFVGDLVTWFRPSTLDELLHLKVNFLTSPLLCCFFKFFLIFLFPQSRKSTKMPNLSLEIQKLELIENLNTLNSPLSSLLPMLLN